MQEQSLNLQLSSAILWIDPKEGIYFTYRLPLWKQGNMEQDGEQKNPKFIELSVTNETQGGTLKLVWGCL